MSLSYQKITPIEVRDPRIVIDNKRDYAVLKGGSQVTPNVFTTTSISQSAITFSCPPPSGSVIVDRKVFLTLTARLTFTGTVLNGNYLLNINKDAPRSFPISSAIDTLSVYINNQQVNVNMSDVVQAMMHYNTDLKLKRLDYSNTPTYPDQSDLYANLNKFVRNPLGLYADSHDELAVGRGGFPGYVIVSNPQNTSGSTITNGVAVVDVKFTEPIVLLSPFHWGHSNVGGFYNVSTMNFTFNFLSQLPNRMWSHDDSTDSTITSATWAFGGMNGGPTSSGFTGVPTLLFNYITPQDTQMLSPNMPITYPYFDITRYPTDFGVVNSGSSATISSSNIQLSSIPRRMYIFVRERNQDLFASPSRTDTFFGIENINIQFNNKAGLLSTATKEQLYQISVKNHCQMSWDQWSGGPVYRSELNPDFLTVAKYGTIGSVLAVEFATDIGLDALDAPGKMGQYQIQVTVIAKNNSSRNIFATLYLVPVLEGTFTIEKLGMASTNIGVLTSNDILDAGKQGFINYKDVENVNGGDFLSGIKDFFSKAHNFIKDNKIISSVMGALPMTAPFAPIARNLGYGEGVMAAGGAKMSKAQLRNRLLRN